MEVGVASHNLFDVALALMLSEALGVTIDIEMLAGMADDQAAAVAERTARVLLYTPVVTRQDFRNALAYLARRLDENTTPDGYLRHALDLVPGSVAWEDGGGSLRQRGPGPPHVRPSRPDPGPRAGNYGGRGRHEPRASVSPTNRPPT